MGSDVLLKVRTSIGPSVYILFDSGKGEPNRKDSLGKRQSCVGNWDCIFSFHKMNISYVFVNQPLKTR